MQEIFLPLVIFNIQSKEKADIMIEDTLEMYARSNKDMRQQIVAEFNKNLEVSLEEFAHILHRPMKHLWVPAIQVIRDIGYPRNSSLISDLVDHLCDGNWPGWSEAIIVLMDINANVVAPFFIQLLLDQGEKRRYWIDDVDGIILALTHMRPEYILPCVPSILYILAKRSEFDDPEPEFLLQVLQCIPIAHYPYAIPALINVTK